MLTDSRVLHIFVVKYISRRQHYINCIMSSQWKKIQREGTTALNSITSKPTSLTIQRYINNAAYFSSKTTKGMLGDTFLFVGLRFLPI